MKIPYYHVNAFTASLFHGNPAGVCLLEEWLPDAILQGIAAENNFSETAFIVAENDTFLLRWFTPAVEVDLCGHATLASVAVMFQELGCSEPAIRFKSQSGLLTAARLSKGLIELDFPARPPAACEAPTALLRGLGTAPKAVLKSRDYLAVYESEAVVAGLTPDMAALAQVDALGVIATAPGVSVDFVSRFFAPRAGIPEDPVTGSAHCTLIPYWAQRLSKMKLLARQISKRGGELLCNLRDDRVGIAGHAVIYCRGHLEVDGLETPSHVTS